MDGPDGSTVVHIWGCHGGHQQRWTLTPSSTAPQQIRHTGTNDRIGVVNVAGTLLVQHKIACNNSIATPLLTLVGIA